MRYTFLVSFLLTCFLASAQQDLIYVNLDQPARDDRFDKFEVVIPLYVVSNDTIETNDFEGVRSSRKIPIKKPAGYANYAYSFLFYNGIPNAPNPGFVNVLVVNYDKANPRLYVDLNNDYDFTNDGEPRAMMTAFNTHDTVLVSLPRADNPQAGIQVKLSRINLMSKYGYRKLLNDYYSVYYNNRKFAGIDYSFREQRYITRSGVVHHGTDSFRIALYDGNTNGLYNDTDTDKVITANMRDSVFDSRDDLHAFTITQKREDLVVEKDGKQFEIIQVDPAGRFIVLKPLQELLPGNRIAAGKKIPKFTFLDWQGTKYKIKKFKKYNVFIYFSNPDAANFSADTATLRKLAALDPDKLKVIGFIDVNKSYELKIFGMYSNLNWIAAFKNKQVNRDLKIRGLPSSLWVAKKRKVVKYNLTPQQFMDAYRQEAH